MLGETGKHLTDTDLLKSIVECCFELMNKSPKGSLQRRVIRALLVKSIPKTSILRDLAVYCKHPWIDVDTCCTQAKPDYDIMQNGTELCKAEFSRKSVKDSIVEDAVSFILHKEQQYLGVILIVFYHKQKQLSYHK